MRSHKDNEQAYGTLYKIWMYICLKNLRWSKNVCKSINDTRSKTLLLIYSFIIYYNSR